MDDRFDRALMRIVLFLLAVLVVLVIIYLGASISYILAHWAS
jgi:hypothetical protein